MPNLCVAELVLAHVTCTHKALGAEATLVGLDLGVSGHVRVQVGLLVKPLATHLASKPLDACKTHFL